MADLDGPAPTKASLKSWWRAFTRKEKHAAPPHALRSALVPPYSPPARGLEPGKSGVGRVFGVPLNDSLQYASVAISLIAADGNQYVYGYVPIVVAKCGMMLKETATQTEGIFRVSGSNKRINQLQGIFDEPPRYGKDFDWTGYSVHDAASVLRRYLNALPEPVIPAGLYLDFTAVLQKPQPIAASIAAYRHLISLLPPASRYLLLYLLDFLSVFARCSDKNLMTASNLAVVFQPGLVSSRGGGHNALLGFPGFVEGKPPPSGSAGSPSPAQVPNAGAQEQAGEHGRGKEVLEFLIEQQAHFMLGLEPPVDEERQKRKGVDEDPATPVVGASAGTPPRAVQSIAAQEILARQEQQPFASTSAVPMGGASDLHRRGSEKSVERRRLRKEREGKEGVKVKRNKTWGTSPSVTPANPSPQVPSTATFSSPSTSYTNTPSLGAPSDSPALSHRPSVKKKARKSNAAPSPVLASAPLHPPPNLLPEPTVSASPSVPAPGPGASHPMQTSASGASQRGADSGGDGGGGGGTGIGILGLGGGGKSRRRSMDPDGGTKR
ncbi:hypothetical protein Rhopal_003340-T1 [Rhodotorula paludigena]|uniref:Rho-GAP domain-containing protein n=1 Tax=Rhodotorula paludigena TaxID=86838 RepID=A0AAV5GCN9_9BASI|nr:hypothetical protein Rhopal_003340-T1 [Rhodotorula paludigena]